MRAPTRTPGQTPGSGPTRYTTSKDATRSVRRLRRCSSRSSGSFKVRSSTGRTRPAMVSRRFAEVDVVEHEGGDPGNPGGVDRCEGEDELRRRDAPSAGHADSYR